VSTSGEHETSDQTIGSILKQARLRSGLDIETMAHALRIRQPYLEAIEDGRYELLPGPTYATGFIRSYAEQLGLDGDRFVDQYHEETKTGSDGVELQFPSPVPDSGKPTIMMMVLGAAALVVVYGVWHVYDKQSFSVSDWIPPIPDQLANLLPGSTETPAESTVDSEELETANDGAASADQDPIAEQVDNQGSADVDGADAGPLPPEIEAPSGEETGLGLTSPPAGPASGTGGETEPVDVVTETPDVAESEFAEQSAAVTDAGSGEGEEATGALAGAQAGDPPPPALANSARVFGDDTDARVILRAREDSWIEVRDGARGELLLARLMRPGDVYLVPNRSGLRLLTGNAGGLDIYVDGDLTPTLGKAGVVRKDVVLDADALRER
jgi:cytoskeleton protein RodZ